MERIAPGPQRVVDPDLLAREQDAVLVDGQVGHEVGRLARRQSRRGETVVPHEKQPGGADGLDRQGVPVRDDQTLLVTEPGGHRAGDQEQDQAEVADQGCHLDPPISVPVQVARVAIIGRADPEAAPTKDAFHHGSLQARFDPDPVGELRIEVGVRLHHPDFGGCAP